MARIHLTPRVYLSQSENGAIPYNEIYGRHRRGLHASGFRRFARRAARRRVAVPLVPAAIIIIEFPFDSRLLPCTPNRRKKRELRVTISALVIERPEYANDSASAILPTKPEYVTQSSLCTGCVWNIRGNLKSISPVSSWHETFSSFRHEGRVLVIPRTCQHTDL